MKRITLLGSTGSIGKNTLEVVRHLKENFKVTALAARDNIDLLEAQAKEFQPQIIAVFNEEKGHLLQKKLPSIPIVCGMEGLKTVASFSNSDMMVSAISGTLGLQPTLAAILAGKSVALANKESLVSGGSLIMKYAQEKGVPILPIDSEHSAIFQCLNGENISSVRRLILTSSGGPFRNYTKDMFENISSEQALCHPTWKMGPKVTVDSSTLMNKGLEVIEAHHLFGLPLSQIEVIIHPQSTIHSMVEFIDHSILAQMGDPTMITPIQYALTYPNRTKGMNQPFDFLKHQKLEFYHPNYSLFRCLRLAFEATKIGGSMPCYMNAANEILVYRFLSHEISWIQIGVFLEQLMEKHQVRPINSVEDILDIDNEARREAKQFTCRGSK